MSASFPVIKNCSAGKCSYNYLGKCCTLAINVGGPEPLCDTFYSTGKKGGYMELVAKVGACKVADCIHNKFYECSSESIEIISSGNRAECAMFQKSL